MTLWLPDPSARDPQAPLLQAEESEGHQLPDPVPVPPGDDPARGPLSGAVAHPVRGLPHTRWENQTASRSVPGAPGLDSNEAPTGLCVSILHTLHLNLNS